MLPHIAPRPGTVLICDYDLGRAEVFPDEMTKRRPVVVLSSRRRRKFGPVIVVPLSTTPPRMLDERHVRIAAGAYWFLRADIDSWAKCEFVCAVSDHRLDRLRRGGAHIALRLNDADYRSIQRAAVAAVGGWDLFSRI